MGWNFIQVGTHVGVPDNRGWLVAVGSVARDGVLQPSQGCTSYRGVCGEIASNWRTVG